MSENKHIGSSFDEFLDKEGILDEAKAFAKASLASLEKLKCPSGGEHWWGFWSLISDPINIDDGSTGGYKYSRQCNVLGCSVLQKVKDLKPVDEPVVYQWKKH